MLGDIPINTAVICGSALGDIYAAYAEGLLRDLEGCVG
jgi:hypothetical protein